MGALLLLLYTGMVFVPFVFLNQDRAFVSPSLRGISASFEGLSFPPDGILVVNTRFMQNQAHLVDLALMRLELFRTFCLPTMVHQTIRQSVLWLIRTDPNLPLDIMNEIIRLLRPHPNFYLILSNNNTIGSEVNFRSLAVTRDMVKTGNYEWLEEAVRLSQDRVVLETVLDADDGIHVNLLRHVYQTAVPRLQRKQQQQQESGDAWLVLCIERHLEWRSTRDLLFLGKHGHDETGEDDRNNRLGLLEWVEEDFCVTPGLTYALAPGTQPPEVLQMSHAILHQNVSLCNVMQRTGCIQRLHDLNDAAAAIRARTTASAGMKNMDHKFEGNVTTSEDVWIDIKRDFFLQEESILRTKEYIKDHLLEFSRDNLHGQCAEGHSCKKSSEIRLFRLVQRIERARKRMERERIAQENATHFLDAISWGLDV